MIAPPSREWSRNTAAPIHSECQHEDAHLGATIQRRRNKIVPLDEVLRSVLSKIVLANNANDIITPDGGVDANAEVTHIPKDNRRIEIAPDTLSGEAPVEEIEWEWDNEADEIGDCHPLVAGADGEHFWCD